MAVIPTVSTRKKVPMNSTMYLPIARDASSLALHIRKLFSDLPFADAKHIDAPHVARDALAHPLVPPADHAAIARVEDLLGLEPRARRALEEVGPERSNGRLSFDSRAVRGRARILEHAVVGHVGHDGVHVVSVESLVEPLDHRTG